MCIGFAAISTTLVINGKAKVSENLEDFSVIFTAATLDGQDVYANVIDDTKKIITFQTNDLKSINDSSVLTYEITNNSSNYDAEVTVNCKVKDDAEAKYTSIKNELENNETIVKAKESLNGTLIIALNKTATEEVREEYVCELTFNAVERNELGSYTGQTEWLFDYTGSEQTFIAPITGTYKIETWGAQGGSGIWSTNVSYGGNGGYSSGIIRFSKNTNIYINVGGRGDDGYMPSSQSSPQTTSNGGYNGGGTGSNVYPSYDYGNGGGGGATHVALVSGQLSTLENNLKNLLIVSGGGGGGNLSCGSGSYYRYNGGHAGGYIGCNGSAWPNYVLGIGGSQEPNLSLTYKGTFGIGGNGDSEGGSGGGGGYYGGSGSGPWASAGGGSGYIGNSLLTEKSMYCYNCTESTEESTKTISTTCVNSTPTENCAKQGNGYARITLIK